MSDSGEQHGIIDSLKASITKLGEAAVEGIRENQSMQTGHVDDAAGHAQNAYDQTKANASDAKDRVDDAATNARGTAQAYVHSAKESLKETSFQLQSEAGLEDSKMKEIGAHLAESGRHAAAHLEARLGGGGAADSAASGTDQSSASGKSGVLGTMNAALQEDHVRLTGS